MAKTLHLHTDIKEYSLSELSQDKKKLIQAAKAAGKKAYAPYSDFLVGAALLLSDGTILQGNNQENAAYPSGLCAERTVLFYFGSQKKAAQKIVALAVTAKKRMATKYIMTGPCGACRQVMLEYENIQKKNYKVYLYESDSRIICIDSAKQLLPIGFDDKNLQ